jgi:hypothetical protein
MYFGDVAVEPAMHFLNGLDFAISVWLGDTHEARFAVWAERGWPRTPAMHPSRHMVERGLTPPEVIEELLVIEIETLRRVAGV